MPNLEEFFAKYNNKGIDFDGYYGFQCMDLYRQYVKEALNVRQSPSVRGASDVWDTYLKTVYDRIDNTPEAVPEKGDIVIWNDRAGNGFGHIAIFASGDVNSFTSFDQNWPVGSLCHFQPHNYKNILGWIRPKTSTITPTPNPDITDKTYIPLGKIGEIEYGSPELQTLRSMILAKDNRIAELVIQAMPSLNIPTVSTPSMPESLDESANLISRLADWITKKLGR